MKQFNLENNLNQNDRNNQRKTIGMWNCLHRFIQLLHGVCFSERLMSNYIMHGKSHSNALYTINCIMHW